MSKLKLAGGVLIIGSLFWQTESKFSPTGRKDWREKWLDINKKVLVSAPIRYGRTSSPGNPDETYTMVFSKKLSKGQFGSAWFVPFKKTIDEKELVDASKELAIAEGVAKNENNPLHHRNWGCIAIKFKEEPNKDHQNAWNNWVNEDNWSKELSDNFCATKEGEDSCVTDKNNTLCELDFDWPDELSSYDFLLASPTAPDSNYPSDAKLEAHLMVHNIRHYYRNNRSAGIITFQDDSTWVN